VLKHSGNYHKDYWGKGGESEQVRDREGGGKRCNVVSRDEGVEGRPKLGGKKKVNLHGLRGSKVGGKHAYTWCRTSRRGRKEGTANVKRRTELVPGRSSCQGKTQGL